MTTLEERIAEMSIDDLRRAYANELTDWAETDTYVRNKASEVLSDRQVNGDSYGVPAIEDIVDILVNKIKL